MLTLQIKIMATYTIKISDTSLKAKHLIGLIKELAKIEKESISIEKIPNATTIEAMEDAIDGKVMKSKNKKDFFEKISN